MNQIDLQGKSIEALKLFNNTIVTSRLYPPEAPQVATAVDRGYKGVKLYLRLYGDLQYSLKGANPYLCGQPLRQEILDSFPNLVVYRQLRLLGLSKLVISSEMDRFAFGQLLSVFNASVEKIKNEGGGLEYVTSLGLASYFPDQIGESDESAAKEGRSDDIRPRKLVKVRPEMVACLFGKDKRPVIEAELQKKMAITETAIDILAACVAHILQDIQKKKMIVVSRNFSLILEKAETLIETNNRTEVALGLAKVLVENLKEPALCVLLAQEYPDGFGSTVYDGLISFLTTEKLAGIMVLFREQLEKAKRIGGVNSSQVQFLGEALLLLMNSKKGKHFLSTEKARTIIHEGERERRKRRLEAGIKGFLQGNSNLLKSEELVDYLPDAVRQIQKNTGGADVALLLSEMVASLKKGSEEVKKSLLKSLITVGENLIVDGQWSDVDLILEPLMEEVRNGGSGDVLLEKTVSLLQQVMQKSWQDGENARGDGILTFFHQIRSGQIPHPASIKTIVGKVQDRGIRRANLPRLLARCLAAPKDETLSCRLILQGPVVLHFLVESLINTDNATDRLKIIDLLTYSPNFLPSVVHERLQEHMPWYGKRNLIKLLGETGNEEDAESVLPYLRHDDFRVQRESFLTLYKIAGRNRKRLLLKALEESSEAIKVQIVGALASFCDSEVAGKLAELLASHEQFAEKNRNDLLLQLLETLGRCSCLPAHKAVHAFLQTREQRATRKIPEQVWAAAEKAMKFLQNELQQTRKKHVQASQLRKNALKQAAKISKTTITQRVITGLPQEQAVRTLLSRGDKTAAVEQVLELIERVARLHNFVQAEKLREWLIEIDSAALSQILQAAEIIDREKIASIDKGHLEIWSGLYDILTTDEFSAVYHALKHKKYENEEIIISQGALQGALFFINSGKVKVYFDDHGSEVLVKTMGRGEIFGGDAFFEASVWTISVAAIGTSEISILKLDALQQWTEDFPGLESKLYNFCKKFEKIEDFIKRSSNDRRLHKRYRISGRVVSTLLDNRGRSIGTNSKVELSDISEGGLSFLVRISQKENGRLLLGRKMQIKLPVVEKFRDGITLIGDILAVKNTYAVENDYSLHMKFDSLLDRKQLHDIVMTMRRESQVIK
jgi:CRP-like cAMP-binding protein